MKLLKIILIFFSIYFIRRFIQMYRVMKALQEQSNLKAHHNPVKTSENDKNVVEADFKVLN